ncbi:MAG: hypothetical protein H6742_20615 [Alphaproteobacteria bacterium]|nr:hypothetical protein [Alphaproteobacteria bacterium]
MPVVAGYIVPGLPHPLLAPDRSPHWRAVRDGFDAAAARIRQAMVDHGADLLVLYSTQWVSVIGHQVQADPDAAWTHVDPEFHQLGSMPYRFRIDADYAQAYAAAAQARGLSCRPVSYRGFPIDTGTIVALQLLNADNALPATTTSCNMYADRGETLVLGKAARDAIDAGGRRAIAVAVTSLSARKHVRPVDPADDQLASAKDAEWNDKLLEILSEGRLEDVAQLARTVAHQAHADSQMRAFWWLSAVMGQHNRYRGEVLAYAPVWGTGAAVVELVPAQVAQGQHEFDEDDVDRYHGDLEVLESAGTQRGPGGAPMGAALGRGLGRVGPGEIPGAAVSLDKLLDQPLPPRPADLAGRMAAPAGTRADRSTTPLHEPPVVAGGTNAAAAPKPVGPYPHARRVGDLLFLSGVGPRQAGTDTIPGGAIRAPDGTPQDYDIEAQTRACIDNIAAILRAAGSDLSRVLDVTAFLVDMDRDFAGYNRVYGEFFATVGATRTTVAVAALPTPIAVELKVVAAAGDVDLAALADGKWTGA